LNIADGAIFGGEFIVDLTQLECVDLADSPMHDILISHLQNDDFFDVANHPKATFVITEACPTAELTPGSGNLQITGDLTMRGQTHSIEFTASSGLTDEGKAAAQASFPIDRTRWGILYGSGKFFHRLAGHLVNDHLEFQLRILTK
jgi:polyisoprenoid-binding protein YceI